MNLKIQSIILGFICLACVSLHAQSLPETLKSIIDGGNTPEEVSKAVASWLDERGLARLQETIDAVPETTKRSAAEWHALALLEKSLLRHEKALAAWTKACASPKDATPAMQLALAHALARERKFSESLSVLEAMDTVKADPVTAHEVIWLLLSLSSEGGLKWDSLALPQRMSELRPDDLELQLLLERQKASGRPSPENVRRAKERLTEAKDERTRHSWLLFTLETELYHGMHNEAATDALQGLAATRANSTEERQLLDVLMQAFQRRGLTSSFKKGMHAEESVAHQFSDRPAVVRCMATSLRGGGSTEAAQKVLSLLPESADVKKLISDWAEEDGREALPLSLPRIEAPRKEEASVNEPPPPAWQQEIESLKGAERLKKLLQIWKTNPQDQAAAFRVIDQYHTTLSNLDSTQATLQILLRTHFASPDSAARQALWRQATRRELHSRLEFQIWWQSLRWRMGQSPAYWEAFTFVHDSISLPALREADRLAPGNEVIKAALARKLWRAGNIEEALFHLQSMTSAHAQAEARLEMALLDMVKGRPHAAARTMFEMAGHETLTPGRAITLGTGLMAWREWPEAVLFLEAQRRRFPADYRLAFLHALALQGSGDLKKAEETFLHLGSFQQEIRLKPADDLFEESELRMHDRAPQNSYGLEKWEQMQNAVRVAFMGGVKLSAWLAQQQRHDDLSEFPLTPPNVGHAGAWGMARLLMRAVDLPAPERQAWVEKARAAGLPMPELLEAGRIIQQKEGFAALKLDEDWIASHLDLPWVCPIWMQQTASSKDPTSQNAELALKIYRTSLASNSRTALQAALRAWKLTPQSPEAAEAVVSALGHGKPEDSRDLLASMHSHLYTMPVQERRRAAEFLLPALNSVFEKSSGPDLHVERRIMRECALLLGAWETAATLADDAQAASQTVNAAADSVTNSLVENALQNPSAVLSWPPMQHVLRSNHLSFYLYGSTEGQAQVYFLNDEEKAAFAASIKDWRSKLLWLLGSDDDKAAREHVRAWVKEQPHDRAAVLAASGLAAAENDLSKALDLLHVRMQSEKKPQDLLLAQLDYLMAGIRTRTPTGAEASLAPPPKAHAERLRQAALKLLPKIQALPQVYLTRWTSVFSSLDLKNEAKVLGKLASQKPNPEDAYRNQPWLGAGASHRNFLERSRGWHENPASIYEISGLMSANQQARAQELVLRSLRRQADTRFSSDAPRGNDLDQWQALIRKHNLAAATMTAAAQGQPATWRRFAQAVHIAEACEDWVQAAGWAEAALKLDATSQTMKLALAGARLRAGGDPAVMVDALHNLPPVEARRSLETLLETAQTSQDFGTQMKLAQALIRLAEQHPALMSPNDGSMGKVVPGTFEILSAAILDRQHHLVAPALYPDFERRQHSDSRSKLEPASQAATPEQLELRKKLFAQFCDVSLKHPEWMRDTLRRLTARQIVDGVPEASVLVDYIKQGMQKESPPQKQSYFNAFAEFGTAITDGGMRMRLAGLALPLLETVYSDTSPAERSYLSADSNKLVQLIGAEIPAPTHPPLWALWKCPLDVTSGEFQHTAEQLALNKERRALMDELWASSEKFPSLRRQIFPKWAAYRLHFVDKVDEVLEVALKLRVPPPSLSLLTDFAAVAVQSYENPHHVLSAELIEALVRRSKASATPDALENIIRKNIDVLVKGRTNQADPMPPLYAEPGKADKLLSKDLQKRRLAVLDRLSELLGRDLTATPELLFVQLEEALRQDQKVSKTTRSIIKLAEQQPDRINDMLELFINASNGRDARRHDTDGYDNGVWELGLRVRWFSTALELGRSLAKSNNGSKPPQFRWLQSWINSLMQPNLLVDPPVPAPSGTEPSHGGVYGSTALLYPRYPLLKKRDELLVAGMELAMQQDSLWLNQFHLYSKLLMERTPSATRQLAAVLDKHCASQPEKYFLALSQWTDNGPFKSVEARLAAASLMVKALDAWPKNQVASDSRQTFERWRQVVLGSHWSDNAVDLPLLTDMPWMLGYNASQKDWALKQPGARERNAAWVHVVDKAMTIPGMFAAVFNDASRLHVEKNPEKIIAAARNLSVEDWRLLQSDLVNLYNSSEERYASVARRIKWGRLVMQLLPMAAALEKYSPKDSQKPTWAADTLRFLQQSPSDTSGPFRAPLPTVEILAEREEVIKQLGDMLLDNPITAVEGFENYAHQQFVSGAPPNATLELARKIMRNDSARLNQRLSHWCTSTLSKKETSMAERSWSIVILLPLAEEWPEEPAGWLAGVSFILAKMPPEGTGPESVKALRERLMNAAMKLPPNGPALDNYARAECTTKEGQQNLKERILSLLAKDRPLAIAWMQAWWRSVHIRMTSETAQPVMDILKAWPADATAAELEWVERFIKALSVSYGPGDPDSDSWNMMIANSKPRVQPPAPGTDAEARRLQQEALVELRQRKVEQPWMSSLEMRLAGHSSLTPKIRIENLRAFFMDPRKTQILAYCSEVMGMDLSVEARRLESGMIRPFMMQEQITPHALAAEIIDVSRCLVVAAQESWLDEAAIKKLRDNSTKLLIQLVSMAAQRTEAQKNNPRFAFTPPGVLESQGLEARALLDAWDAMTAKAQKSAVTPGELPRVLEAQLKAGEKPAVLAELVGGMLKQDPAATANALTIWSNTLHDHRLPLPAFLNAGRLAAILAERWIPDLPPPDWLVLVTQGWTLGGWAMPEAPQPSRQPLDEFPPGFPQRFPIRSIPSTMTRSISREEVAQYESLEKEIRPQFIAVLRRFPSCTNDSYFRVIHTTALRTGGLPAEEASKLALAHLQARPHSISSIQLPTASKRPPRRPIDPLPILDAIPYLLDHAMQSGEHGDLPTEQGKIIRASLKPEALVFYEALETLATCSKADFPKAASKLMHSNPGLTTIDCAMWILRSAAFKKADIPAATWLEISFLKEHFISGDNPERQLTMAYAWLRYRASMPKSNPTQDARDLLHLLLGAEYSRDKMLAAINPPPQKRTYFSWHGWPAGSRASINHQCRWAYSLMETMTGVQDLFKTNLDLAYENGVAEQYGALAWLMKASRPRIWESADKQRWRGWLLNSGLLADDTFPDSHWLIPHDGLAPIWEFAKVCGLHSNFKTEATEWLQEQQTKHPGIGAALLLLACQRAHNTDLSIQDIESALSPCRAQLQRAPKTHRAALAAALAALQPGLEAAVKAAPPSSVLQLLPEPLVAEEIKTMARRCLTGEEIPGTGTSAKIRTRLHPLANVLVRLLQSGYKQTSEVMNACVKRLAKEKWDMPDAAAQIGTEAWIKEHLGFLMLDEAGASSSYYSNEFVTVVTRANDDERRHLMSLVLRFHLQNNHHFISTLLSSRLLSSAPTLFNNNSSISLNGSDLYSQLKSMLPVADHGEGFLLVDFLSKTPLSMPALEKFAALAEARSPKSSLSQTAQYLLQSRKAAILGKDAPALVPPAAFWNDDALSPAALLSVIHQSNTAPPSAVRARALEAWTRLALINNGDYPEDHLLNHSLTWLNDAEPDAQLASAVDATAAALIYWMGQKENSYYFVSIGNEKSLGRKIIQPLAAMLNRAGLKERRTELVHAAAAKSILPLDVMLDDWRTATDVSKSVRDWLPLYFHAQMDDPSTLWSYETGDQPQLSRQDETWLAELSFAKGDPLHKLTASLMLAALPDATTSPPSVPRFERIRQRLAAIDLSIEEELRALNRFLELSGSAEELLPELLQLIRKHPSVQKWQSDAKSAAGNPSHANHEISGPRVKIITLWAAAEALHASNRQPWTQLAKEVARVRQATEQMEKNNPHTARLIDHTWQLQRTWEDIPCVITARIIDHYLTVDSKAPAGLLSMWDELRATTENFRSDDAAMALALHQAQATSKTERAQEMLRRFKSLRCSSKNLLRILETSAVYGLSPAEKWPLLTELELSSHLDPSSVFAASIKARFATPAELTSMISTLTPEEAASCAASAADWLDTAASHADCTSFISRLAALDQSKLKPSVWSQLQQHAAAHDDADLADKLQRKWQEAASDFDAKAPQ